MKNKNFLIGLFLGLFLGCGLTLLMEKIFFPCKQCVETPALFEGELTPSAEDSVSESLEELPQNLEDAEEIPPSDAAKDTIPDSRPSEDDGGVN